MQNNTYSLRQIIFAWILVFKISFFIFIYILLSKLFSQYVDNSSFKDLRYSKLLIEKEVTKEEINLKNNLSRHINSRMFTSALKEKNVESVLKYIKNWKSLGRLYRISLFNKEGLKVSLIDLNPISDNALMSNSLTAKLKGGYEVTKYYIEKENLFIQVTRNILDQEGLSIGYIQESKQLDLGRVKSILPEQTKFLVSDNSNIFSINDTLSDKFKRKLLNIKSEAFEISSGKVFFDGLVYKVDDRNNILILKEKLKNIFYLSFYKNYLLYFVIYILLIGLIFYLSFNYTVTKPLEDLCLYIKSNFKDKKTSMSQLKEIREIESLVQSRVGEFNTVISEAHAGKKRDVNMMVASLAHELNNALSYIGGNISFLEDEMSEKEPDKEEINESLVDIKSGFDSMKNIVSDLKVFSSQSDYKIKSIFISEIFDQIKKVFNNIEITNELENRKISVDSDRLFQVLQNIIQNANHAKDKDEILVKIAAYKVPNEDYMFIDVSDNGLGVPKNIQDKIFQPFFTTKKNKGGTGLGLALSLDIMMGMEGDLFLKDSSEQGSIFCLKVKLV